MRDSTAGAKDRPGTPRWSACTVTNAYVRTDYKSPSHPERLSHRKLVLAYATSFWSIGLAWVIHHHIFRAIRRFNHTLTLINMLLLLVIAFVPFPTAITADYLKNADQQRFAMMIYSGTWLMFAVFLNLLWWYAPRTPAGARHRSGVG